ncbi:hypothetical protein STAQ_32320 [Allostella sp. ATCC 35155]|nr:hypothetical protein STAQ_32320 [Stella sp. ATCC 35155]
MVPARLRGALLMLAALAIPAAAAAVQPVDLELVLAVDVSGSIDRDEAKLQRDGYVAALTDPQVLAAIRGGLHGRIAVTYLEWAGYRHRRLVAEWHLVQDALSAAALAARIAEAPIATGVSTSISGAIQFALPLFGAAGFRGERRVIDISGDGPNNDGPAIDAARDAALAQGVTINGLPILNERPNAANFPQLDDLDAYYEGCVIGGPGAFIVVADGFASFAAAVKRKLILEIAGRVRPVRAIPVRFARVSYAAGCDVGERQLREYLRTRGGMRD